MANSNIKALYGIPVEPFSLDGAKDYGKATMQIGLVRLCLMGLIYL